MATELATKSLRIALDYDRTFTEDKTLWSDFVKHCRTRGHVVAFVTFREKEDHWSNRDIEKDAAELQLSIVYTAGGQKADHFKADIWIDDMPMLIPSKDSMLIGSLSLGK